MNSRSKTNMLSLSPFQLWIFLYLFISGHLFILVNSSQKFVPNGRYGRRSDLPPIPSLISSPAANYFYEISDSPFPISNDEVDSFVTQDGETLNVNNNQNVGSIQLASTNSGDNDWFSIVSLLRQLLFRCSVLEDKKLMLWCVKSFPLQLTMNNNKVISKVRPLSSSFTWDRLQQRRQQLQQLQQKLQSAKKQQKQRQQQGQDQDHV